MKFGLKNAEILMICLDYSFFFYKQPVYKQTGLRYQIVKQLSRLFTKQQ